MEAYLQITGLDMHDAAGIRMRASCIFLPRGRMIIV